MRQVHLFLTTALLIMFFNVPDIESAQFRNIFSVTHIDYENIGVSTVFENALVSHIKPGISALVRVYHDRRSDWHNSIITIGPVLNLNRYHYVELTYGYGYDKDNRRADYLSFELTREKPRYLAGIGFRHSTYPGYTYNMLSPGMKFYVTSRVALWGKIFIIKDSDDNFDLACWTDVEFFITRRFSVRAGITGGNRLYNPEYEFLFDGKTNMRFFSVLSQLSYSVSDNISVKFLFENMSRQSKYTDIKNTLIIDARF